MLTITLKIDEVEIKEMEVVNQQVFRLRRDNGECPYSIMVRDKDGSTDMGFVIHKREDGLIALTHKVFDKLNWNELCPEE